MRKLFISQSLKHAPGYSVGWHKGRVRMMENMWGDFIGRATVR